MVTKLEIRRKIENLIDDYTPYRPILDTERMRGAREALINLANQFK